VFHRTTRLDRILTVIAVTAAAGASWAGTADAAQRPSAAGARALAAAAAPAKATLTPTSVTAGSTGNQFTLKITAVAALSGRASVTIPAGWSAPQAANPAGAGFVTSAKGTCASAAKPAVTGTGPWTIAVAMKCAAGAHFTVTYGAGTGGALVQAPARAASYTFATSVKLGTTSHKLPVPPVVVQPGPAADLAVSGLPSPGETGVPVPVTVTAEDAFGNVTTGYQGTVHFTSSDPAAALPGDYTFTTADAGTHTFAGGVTFVHQGAQSVTATDTANSAMTGSDSAALDGVLWVSPTGSDSNTGTQAQPLRTVSAAVAKAALTSPAFAVDVAAGTYNEGAGVTVPGNMTIEGGFDPSTWQHSGTEKSTITGAPQAVYASGAPGVLLEDLTLQGSAGGGGQSSYGLRAVNNSSVTLDFVTVSAGNALPGPSGSWGNQGASGQGGAFGGNAQSSGGCTSSFGPGGIGGSYVTIGGNGGAGGCSGGNGAPGAPGATATGGASGGVGGSGGAGDNQPLATGGHGGTGAVGANGLPGAGGVATLADAGSTWAGGSGTGGTAGQNGGGGGGGGGGGALTTCTLGGIICTFNGGAGGGGGGGGGGAGGPGGSGGYGGGSFGIYLWNSTVSVRDYSTITAGNGGAGGTGGNGGSGGAGGFGNIGGSGINGSGTGGQGGSGGNGGFGGAGGGGTGGPSIGVFRGGSSTATTDASDTITFGTAGQGGAGGNSNGTGAPAGQPGQAGAILP